MSPPDAPPGTQFRVLNLDPEHTRTDREKRTVEASLSSETPVQRKGLNEVLLHTPEAIDLTRAKHGLPLLLHHDSTKQVGVVENVRIQGRRLLGTLRFGKSKAAREAFDEVAEGIFRNLSVGYVIEKAERARGNVLRATRWSLLECSIVSVPADQSIGIGRSQINVDTRHKEASMPEVPTGSDFGGAKRERERASKILEYGERFGCESEAARAVAEGTSFEGFREHVLTNLESRPTRTPPPQMTHPTPLGMTDDEASRFRITRLIEAMASGDWSDAGLEQEAIRATAPGKHGGVVLPAEVVNRSVLTTDTVSSLTPSANRPQNLVDYVRNRSVLNTVGATFLTGLEGSSVTIPRQTGTATLTYVDEEEQISETALSGDQLTLNPTTLGAYQTISRRALLGASLDMENLVRSDLAGAAAAEIDRIALVGDGTSNAPTGLLTAVSGTAQLVSLTSNTLDWPAITSFEGRLDDGDGSTAWVINPSTRAYLMRTRKGDGTNDVDEFSMTDARLQDGMATLAGFPAAVTSNLPTNYGGAYSPVILGRWADLMVGMWSTVEILADPFTGFRKGNVQVRVLVDFDVAVRRSSSFAVAIDADVS